MTGGYDVYQMDSRFKLFDVPDQNFKFFLKILKIRCIDNIAKSLEVSSLRYGQDRDMTHLDHRVSVATEHRLRKSAGPPGTHHDETRTQPPRLSEQRRRKISTPNNVVFNWL